MGQFLGKPDVGDNADESEKAPAFPDYMLDADVDCPPVSRSRTRRNGDMAVLQTTL